MAKSAPNWLMEEEARANEQASSGRPVNPSAKGGPAPAKPKRVQKGFQVEQGRAVKWDMLVAKMKNDPVNKRSGPQLLDEAMDHLFAKYLTD